MFIAESYVENICESGYWDDNPWRKDPEKIRIILEEYARNMSQLVKHSEMIVEINENYKQMSDRTFYNYLNTLYF